LNTKIFCNINYEYVVIYTLNKFSYFVMRVCGFVCNIF